MLQGGCDERRIHPSVGGWRARQHESGAALMPEHSGKPRPIAVLGIATVYAAFGLWALTSAFGAVSATVDWTLGVSFGAALLLAAVYLYRLQRVAIPLFGAALVISVGATFLAVARGVPGAGRGAAFGWLLLIAVIVYAWRLAKDGTLR